MGILIIRLLVRTSLGLHACGQYVINILHRVACMQSSLTLCDPTDGSPPGSTVHGILQARILEGVAISYSRGSSRPGMEPVSLVSPALAGRFFYCCTTWEAATWEALSLCLKQGPGSTPRVHHRLQAGRGRLPASVFWWPAL